MDPSLLIFDVKEKEPGAAKAPSFPQPKPTTTGFPEHRKRTKVSAFKQKRQGQGVLSHDQRPNTSPQVPDGPPSDGAQRPPAKKDLEATEHQRIDRENSDRLAAMSPQEIEAARQELFNGLDASMLQTLLKRANLDDSTAPSPFDDISRPNPNTDASDNPTQEATRTHVADAPSPSGGEIPGPTSKAPEIANTASARDTQQVPAPTVVDEEDEPSTTANPVLSTEAPPLPPSATAPVPDAAAAADADTDAPKPHWPHPPRAPDLDPADPDFLSALHAHYFPSLPADPSRLAWMAPLPTPHSPADLDSPYHPSQSSLPVSALRFDFRGALLPPRIARAVPASKGLHHHGEAPEAAGYTVAELARLCRSQVPGQRCLAYQTLGRVLFRLGRGEFGAPGDDAGVADGVWAQMRDGAVLRSLLDEAGAAPNGSAGGPGRYHRSAHAFAVEAVWLFEKGGWKERMRKAR
ncbi:RPAP1-like protein [Xylariaceae sp. FL0804]|nr:RPAP1-like protein [Xylariaceae sp. FL0804]